MSRQLTTDQENFLIEYLDGFVAENVVSSMARRIWDKYSANRDLNGKWHTPTDPRIRAIIEAIYDRAWQDMSDDQIVEFEELGGYRIDPAGETRYLRGNRCWRGYAPVRGKKPYTKGSCRKVRRNPVPPKRVAAVACRGLAKRKKHRRGGTPVGVARARDLCNRRNLSKKTLGRMRSYFARHRASKAENAKRKSDPTSAAAIADDLWGGTAGMKWAKHLSH